MNRLFLILLSLIIGVISLSFLRQVLEQLVVEGPVLFFIFGIVLGVIVRYFFRGSHLWNTFWHEMTHAFWAKIFRAKIGTIMISKERGGYISHRGTLSGALPLVALAPYFFPMVPLLIVLVKLFLKPVYYQPIAFIIGFFLFIFYSDLVVTLRTPQPDIEKTGAIVSFFIISMLNLFFLSIILISVTDQKPFVDYLYGMIVFK